MVDARLPLPWETNEHGWTVKVRSKLVACGFKQHQRIAFRDAFVSVVSSSSVRLLSAVACRCDIVDWFKCRQFFCPIRSRRRRFSVITLRIWWSYWLTTSKQAWRTWGFYLKICFKSAWLICNSCLIGDGRVAMTAAVVRVTRICAICSTMT